MPSCLLESPQAEVDGVQISTVRLESLSPAELGDLQSLLDAAEQARAARFRFERDRRNYIAAHGFLRRLLGAALRKPASALVFEYGAHGKPMLAASSMHLRTLRFNLSHSAGWAMVALAWNREVGVDLEDATSIGRNEDELSELAARVLSAREMAIWRALPDAAARRVAFFRAWTRKEAYTKATGEGVFAKLRSIELVLDAAAPKSSLMIRLPREQTGGWTVHDLPAPEGFAAALVVAA